MNCEGITGGVACRDQFYPRTSVRVSIATPIRNVQFTRELSARERTCTHVWPIADYQVVLCSPIGPRITDITDPSIVIECVEENLTPTASPVWQARTIGYR